MPPHSAKDELREALLDAATQSFRRAGPSAWYRARGKLRFDPIYFSLLQRGLLPDDGTLLDLGCGQGILLALIVAASRQYRSGHWPAGWQAPPQGLHLEGLECRPDRVAVARAALGTDARIEQQDIRVAEFPSCSVVTALDVLLYLEEQEQRRVLERAVRALNPGGVLLLREADAGAGAAFQVTRWSEYFLEVTRGRFRPRLHYRAAGEWVDLLEGLDMVVRAEPMSSGTPFSNMLFVAKRRAK
ncbi:MAG TPA: methyltransferase domain-containing protein [Burkholderiales bacterium]|jgi:SAM-dependent methyltransferase